MSSRPSLFSLVQCQSWGDKSVLLKRPAGQLLKAEGAERMLSLSARCSWGKRFKRNRGEPLKAHLGLILHKDLPSHWMFHRSAWESAEEGLDSIKAFHSWRVIINSEEDFDFFFNTSVELFLKVLIRATFITRAHSRLDCYNLVPSWTSDRRNELRTIFGGACGFSKTTPDCPGDLRRDASCDCITTHLPTSITAKETCEWNFGSSSSFLLRRREKQRKRMFLCFYVFKDIDYWLTCCNQTV